MLTLFTVVKFITIWCLPYCVRVLNQQAWVSWIPLLQCIYLSALAKPCDVGKGNEVNKTTS